MIKIVYEGLQKPAVKELKKELVEVIIKEAHQHNLRAYGHIAEVPKAITAIEYNIDGLVHLPSSYADNQELDELIQLMKENDIAVATTILVFKDFADILEKQGEQEMSASMLETVEKMTQALQKIVEEKPELIVIGTDSPHLPPSESYHREIQLIEQAGLTPVQIIQAATRNAAIFLGKGDELGTIEAGKKADLILVEGDPLQDINALKNVQVVLQNGKVTVDNRD